MPRGGSPRREQDAEEALAQGAALEARSHAFAAEVGRRLLRRRCCQVWCACAALASLVVSVALVAPWVPVGAGPAPTPPAQQPVPTPTAAPVPGPAPTSAPGVGPRRRPEDSVHVLAGTGTKGDNSPSDGNVLPVIKRPHGFNDWAPQTNGEGNAWWFRRSDQEFYGLRCTHQPSPWVGDWGHFLVTPSLLDPSGGAAAQFDPEAANLLPYLLQAHIKDAHHQDTFVEFAPTNHAGLLRVTFPPNGWSKGHLVLSIDQGSVECREDPGGGVVIGTSTASSGGVPPLWRGTFFAMRPWKGEGVCSSRPGSATLTFPVDKGPVVVALATSLISLEQAERNLELELGSKNFVEVVAEGQKEWGDLLGRVHVEPLDETQFQVFYTQLWRASLYPRFLTEIDAEGREVHWSPYDGHVHSGKLVADSGFWDAYRTVYVLQSVTAPATLGNLIEGWVNAFEEAGWLPQWPSPGSRSSMVGSMGDVVLGDAIAKSLWGVVGGFDVDQAYAAILKDATVPGAGPYGRAALDQYVQLGYVPMGEASECVSRSMNYYLSDAVVARAAQLLGRPLEEQQMLEGRSRNYTTLFDSASMFFRQKAADGQFAQPFDPLNWKWGFTEGGAWQYRFYVPHDVEGLQALYQGHLCAAIEEMLTHTEAPAYKVGGYGHVIHEMMEAAATQPEFGYYDHGNQPVHHILWIAKKAGCTALAERYLRKVLSRLYTVRGYAGDEDNGEMAAWYVLAALGIYQLEGAKDELILGSPAVVAARVTLPGGKTLAVTTQNQAEENVYVQSVTWQPDRSEERREISDSVIRYTELMAGGTLEFRMGSAPPTSRASV